MFDDTVTSHVYRAAKTNYFDPKEANQVYSDDPVWVGNPSFRITRESIMEIQVTDTMLDGF